VESPCIPDSHPHRVTNIKCCIDTVISPDDGHIVARDMKRKEINIPRKVVHQVGFIYGITVRNISCFIISYNVFVFVYSNSSISITIQNLIRVNTIFYSHNSR